jgi:hypothetical protein
MTTTHTPGPWSEIEGFITGRFNSTGEVYDICDPRCAPPDDADTLAEMNANAALISAAPEMLNALEDALYLIDEHRTLTGGDGDITAMYIRSLIRKARGEA